jgi:hypothetical protein
MQRILSLAVVATQLHPSAKGRGPRPVSFKVDWAKPGFGRTIAFVCTWIMRTINVPGADPARLIPVVVEEVSSVFAVSSPS